MVRGKFMTSKIPTSYIISILKEGGHIASWVNYDTATGSKGLASGGLQGVSLRDKKGKDLYTLNLQDVNNVKKSVDLEETVWEDYRYQVSGVEYRIKCTPELSGSGQFGIYEHCNLPPTKEGHDGCLGTLDESVVMNVCCGHGCKEVAYVQYWDGSRVSGQEALEKIKELKGETK